MFSLDLILLFCMGILFAMDLLFELSRCLHS